MAEEDRRNRDIVLAPNEWMHVRDNTKGEVNVYVGPTKVTIGDGDKPVVFDEKAKRFMDVDQARAVRTHITAPEGYYVVLKNPAYDSQNKHRHPTGAGKANQADMQIGRKVNLPGPDSFPLYPGQMAKVLKGHNLRSNQYLLVRVYDDEAAKNNWSSAIVKPQTDSGVTPTAQPVPDITMGKLLVIRGTEVAFYIPPTGVEVVADSEGNLVREAVTLERLEYCLLRDENGNKRYERGPKVVFPEPTEIFSDREIERDGKKVKTRKFRAIELNENAGIYIKVIADYADGDERRTQGEELFITGKQERIYFPREEHAIIKYGGEELHYGIAIPAGEARYVLDRNVGTIETIRGPQIFLPDPRSQVIVRRLLDFKTCSVLYPNNPAAIAHNAALAGLDVATYTASLPAMAEVKTRGGIIGLAAAAAGPMEASALIGSNLASAGLTAGATYGNAIYAVSDDAIARGLAERSGRGFDGDTIMRKAGFTEPRTITLSTKFDGAVSCDIWSGYAMLLVSKGGGRRVVEGPQTIMLEYDEHPQILSLSTGKPKETTSLLRTAYLLTRGNKVSDIAEVETSDFCKLRVKVSYRVDFEGEDREKWFAVENYTKLLADNLRSKLRSAAKRVSVQEFYGAPEDIVRNAVLGMPQAGSAQRPGTKFEENGMRVYDVDVLAVELDNQEISQELLKSQREVIKHALTIQSQRRALEFALESQEIERRKAEAMTATVELQHKLKTRELEVRSALEMATLKTGSLMSEERHAQVHKAEESRIAVEKLTIAADRAKHDQAIEIDAARLEHRLTELRAQAQAFIDQHKALDPNLAAALSTFGERAMIERAAEALAPLSMVKGTGVMELLSTFLAGTPLAKQLENGKNGTARTLDSPRHP